MSTINQRSSSWSVGGAARRHVAVRTGTMLIASGIALTASARAVAQPASAPAASTQASSATQQVAASPQDGRWSPWLGCWRPIENLSGHVDTSQEPTPAALRICVTADRGGALLTTFSGDREVLRQRMIADGERHDLEEPGCSGWQRDEWSASGQGLYSFAELTCANEPTRKIAGLAWNNSRTWLDVQTIDTGGRQNIRVRTYRRVDDEGAAGATSRTAAATAPLRFSLADVQEASGKLPSAVVEAALVETDSQFSLGSRELLRLDAANVPDRIVDLMVALSYPKKFVIERRTPMRVRGASGGGGGGGGDLFWPIDAGFGIFGWIDPFYMSRYWSMFYSPYGYGYWGYADPYYYPGGGFIIIVPPDTNPAPVQHGRVIADAGYTRVFPRPSAPQGGVGGGGWESSPSGAGTGGSGASSSGGTASPAGYSGGGGGGDRTAQPRNPG